MYVTGCLKNEFNEIKDLKGCFENRLPYLVQQK